MSLIRVSYSQRRRRRQDLPTYDYNPQNAAISKLNMCAFLLLFDIIVVI